MTDVRTHHLGDGCFPPHSGPGVVVVEVVPATTYYVLSSNKRIHWSMRYEAQRFWRGATRALASHTQQFQRAHVTAWFQWENRRRRDVHNYMQLVVKPCIDGLVDAKVIPDDSDRHLIGPDLRVTAQPGRFRLVIVVEEV